LGYYVVAIDARDISGYEEVLKPADELHILESFDQICNLDFVPGSAFIVCSFSHKTDGDILNVILSKGPSYVGMLGGKPKICALFTKLKENGYSEETLRRVHAPIGLDLGGEKPAEIAVSIMAEVLAARNGGSCRSMSEILRDSIFPL
jgi:xanthine dehydrogenase accessory factor